MKPASVLGYAIGGVLLASSFLHAFAGWPAFSGPLRAAGTDANLIAGLSAGWYFGSVCMFAFGAIVVASARAQQRACGDSLTPVWLIAAACVVFGGGASLLRRPNAHFVFFLVVGLLVGAYAYLARPR